MGSWDEGEPLDQQRNSDIGGWAGRELYIAMRSTGSLLGLLVLADESIDNQPTNIDRVERGPGQSTDGSIVRIVLVPGGSGRYLCLCIRRLQDATVMSYRTMGVLIGYI